MDFQEAFEIAKQVLIDKHIIIMTVVLLLYLALVNYVVRYRKKPPKVRKVHHKTPAPKPAAISETEDTDEIDKASTQTAKSKSAPVKK